MRILIFSTAYLPLIGGAEVALKELTDRLGDSEFDMLTAAIIPGLPKEETIGRVRVFRLGWGRPFDKFLLPWLARRKAEVLHHTKPYDAIWVMMASYAAFAAESFKRAHPGVPMLLTLQEGDPPEKIARRVCLVKGWFKNIFLRADGLQTISRFLMAWGKSQGFAGRVAEVVPNGVDLKKFAPVPPEVRQAERRRFGFSADDFVVVTTSRLVPKNGIDLVLRALPKLPPRVKFLIAGGGEQEQDLKALASRLGVSSRCVFTGAVPHDRLPAVQSAGDVFCRPSRSEGLGISFIEAMAAGLPVVATPVGGIPDIVIDGENGLMAEPESPDSVAAAIARLEADRGLFSLLKEGALRASKKYSWDDIAGRMRALFEKTAAK